MAGWAYADIWEAIAAAVPGRRAQVQGPRELSWGEFDARANAIARAFLDAGLKQQSKVAAFLYNGPEYLETYYAAFKAGLAPVNTNYRYGVEELVYLFDNADAEAVVFHAAFAEVAAKARARLPKVKAWIAVAQPGHPAPDWAEDYEVIADRAEGRVIAPWGRSGDDLLLMYTGGTTGMPKGVMWRQEDIFFAAMGGGGWGAEPISVADQLVGRLNPDESGRLAMLVVGPLMHGNAQWAMWNAIMMAGTTVLYTEHHFDPDRILRMIGDEGASKALKTDTSPMAKRTSAPTSWAATCSARSVERGAATVGRW